MKFVLYVVGGQPQWIAYGAIAIAAGLGLVLAGRRLGQKRA